MKHPPIISGDFRLSIWDETTGDTMFSGYVSSIELGFHPNDDVLIKSFYQEEVTITLNRSIYPPHNFLWRVTISNNWLRRFGGTVRRICGVGKTRKKAQP